MSRKQYITLVVLAVSAAFVGGMVSAKLPDVVHAAADDGTQKLDTLEVRVLKVVDKEGRTRAWLGMEEGDPLFVMQTRSGEPRMAFGAHDTGAGISLMGDEKKTGVVVFEPEKKRVVWQAPETLEVPLGK
jgi:hypothetical protein